jgi:hypothetical protein
MPAARDPKLRRSGAEPHTKVALPTCAAKTRRGTLCSKAAGWRTPHPGQGRCYLHGGKTPIKHGRYSTITRTRIRDLIEQHEADADPLNIFPEIAALRALFQEFIERYDEHTEALLAWHASWQLTRRPLPEDKLMAFEAIVAEWEISLAEMGEAATEKQTSDAAAARKFIQILRGEDLEAKPRTILDLTDAYRVLGEIGKMVERVEKARSANAISRPDLNRIMQEMWRSVEGRVSDEAVKAAIRDDWMRVAL